MGYEGGTVTLGSPGDTKMLTAENALRRAKHGALGARILDNHAVRLRVSNAAGSESVTIQVVSHHDLADLVDCTARLMHSDLSWAFGAAGNIEAGDDQDTEGDGKTALDMVNRWLQ